MYISVKHNKALNVLNFETQSMSQSDSELRSI